MSGCAECDHPAVATWWVVAQRAARPRHKLLPDSPGQRPAPTAVRAGPSSTTMSPSSLAANRARRPSATTAGARRRRRIKTFAGSSQRRTWARMWHRLRLPRAHRTHRRRISHPGPPCQNSASLQVTVGFHGHSQVTSGQTQSDATAPLRRRESPRSANGLRPAFPQVEARFALYPRPDSNRRYRLERAAC
jgi:hypothetical protein